MGHFRKGATRSKRRTLTILRKESLLGIMSSLQRRSQQARSSLLRKEPTASLPNNSKHYLVASRFKTKSFTKTKMNKEKTGICLIMMSVQIVRLTPAKNKILPLRLLRPVRRRQKITIQHRNFKK